MNHPLPMAERLKGEGLCCPICRHTEVSVTDSRPAVLGDNITTVRRRRRCGRCEHRFTTYEISAEVIERLDALVLDRAGVSRSAVVMECIGKLQELL